MKSVEVGAGHTRNYGITVVKSRTDYCTCLHVGGLSRHRRPHVMECVNVEVTASIHIVDVLVEGESLSERHSEALDVFGEGEWCPSDG